MAVGLSGEGYNTRIITKALLDSNQDDPATVASALAGIGSDGPTVAAELLWAFHTDLETNLILLRDAGYSLSVLTDALRSTWKGLYDLRKGAFILKGLGFDTLDIAAAVFASYNLSQSDISVAAAMLREAGFDAADTGTTILALAAQTDAPDALGQTLTDGGFHAYSVASALETIYGYTGEVLGASLEAGLPLEVALSRLCNAWSLNAQSAEEVYNTLLDAGMSGKEAIETLGRYCELNAVVDLAYSHGWSAVDISRFMLEHRWLTPEVIVPALSLAGYPISDAAAVLRNVFHVAGGIAGPLLVTTYGSTDAELSTAMRGAGFDSIAVTQALTRLPGRLDEDIVRVLREAGFSLEEITIGMDAVYFQEERIAAALLETGVLEVAEVVQGLQAAGRRFDPSMIWALCQAGYPVLSVLDAWVDQTGASPGKVVGLKDHQYVCDACGLPWRYESEDATVWIGYLQTLFQPADDAEARGMALDALRLNRFLAAEAQKAIRDTLGDPGAAVMLGDLLQAGYGTKEALDALYYVYGLNNMSHLISLALDAGIRPIDAADYLSGHTIHGVVGILAQAGLSAEDMALVLRLTYETTAGEAIEYLDHAGCPVIACYSSADVVSAVDMAFNTDPIIAIVQQMLGDSTSPRSAAMHLSGRFGLDITGTAAALKDGGFSQSDVMYGVFKAFPEEWARTVGSYVWDRPETHHALRQVLQDVYGVTSTLDQLNGVFDVARRDWGGGWDKDPIRHSITMLHYGPYNLTEIVLHLRDRVPYDDQVFTSNIGPVIDFLFENVGPYRQNGHGYDAILDAVTSVYGEVDMQWAAADWVKLQLQKADSVCTSCLAAMVRERFLAGGDKPVETALILHHAGQDLDEVLSEIAVEYYTTNRTKLDALVLEGVNQVSGLQNMSTLLVDFGRDLIDIYDALREMFPTASRGDVMNALMEGGVYAGQLEEALIRSPGNWIEYGQKDDTVADILPNIIGDVHDANWLMQQMGYSLEERLDRLASTFAPHQVMYHVSGDVTVLAGFFRTKGVPARQVALGIDYHYRTSTSPVVIADILWRAGYPWQEIVFALAPSDIAFPGEPAPDGQYRGASTGDLFRAMKPIIDEGAVSAADIVRELNALKYMDLFELVQGVYEGIGAQETYRTVRAIQDLGQWWSVAESLSGTHVFPQIVAIHVLWSFGEDANFAARMTLDQVTSWPKIADTHFMLHMAGYDYWAARNAAKYAHGWFDPEYWLNAAGGGGLDGSIFDLLGLADNLNKKK